MMQITYTKHAWADMRYTSLENIKDGVLHPLLGDAPGTGCYFESEGYAPVGVATITIEIYSEDEIISGQVSALKAQLESVRADAQQKENQILRQISQLQALTMEPK